MRHKAPRPRYDYTQGPIGRGLLYLSVPIFLEQIAWNIDTIVEIYWVGRLGAASLAAMSLGFMVHVFVRSGGMGVRIAGQALVAQRIGAGDAEAASLLAGQTILLQALYFLPVSLLGAWLSEEIMEALSSDPEIIRLGTLYLRAGFFALLFTDGIFTLAGLFRGAGEPLLSLWPMIASTLVTAAAMPLLIFGAGVLPELGLAGASWGLGVGRLVGCAIMMGILFTGRSRLNLRPAHLRLERAPLLRLLSLGWPAGGQVLFERSANIVLVAILSRFGPLALAAWGVGNRVNNMGRTPGFALSGAVRTLVGQNIGAGRPGRARQAAWVSLLWVALIMGAVTVGILLWAEGMVRFFGLAGEAVPVGVLCMQVLGLGVGLEAVRRVLSGVFEGAADTKPPMIVEGAVRWGVLLPGAWALGVALGFEDAGVWAAVAASQVLGGVALLAWFLWGWWSRMRAMEEAAAPAAASAPDRPPSRPGLLS